MSYSLNSLSCSSSSASRLRQEKKQLDEDEEVEEEKLGGAAAETIRLIMSSPDALACSIIYVCRVLHLCDALV